MVWKLLWDCRLIARIDAEQDEPSSGQPSNDEQERTDPQDEDESPGKESNTISRHTDDEDNVSDAESVRILLHDIRYPRRLPPLQERIKKAAKRVVQQMDYTQLMEDRMKDMEMRLQLIENKGVEPESPTPSARKTNRPVEFIMDIKRMTFQEYSATDPNSVFKNTGTIVVLKHKCRHEFQGQLPYHLIDVVISTTLQPQRLGKDQSTKPGANLPGLDTSSLAMPAQDLTTNDGQFIQPERIRINSSLLLQALEKITGASFTDSWVGEDEFELRDQVILRPFKLLVTFEKEIRDEIDRLEQIHMLSENERETSILETAEGEDCDPPPPPIPSSSHGISDSSSLDHAVGLQDNKSQLASTPVSVHGENEGMLPLESMRCLEELRVLKELLDKDLKSTFDLRKQIKDGVARSISFQDLWHLFPLGGEIVSNDSNGQNQTYRVLNVSGGRPFLCSRYQADMDAWESTSKDLPKFEILSFFYDFDGKELGACQESHTIKSYDGLKAITSLPCFPIIYSKNSRGLKPRDFFVERGRRFIELARRMDVVHKRYDGLTLAMDGLREEVRPIPNIKPLTKICSIRSIPRS